MAYTAEKETAVTMDNNEYKIYEPQVAKDMEDKDVTIKKLSGTFSLQRLEQDKTQYQAQITDMESRIVDINNKIASIENLVVAK